MKRATLALMFAIAIAWGLAVTDGHAHGADPGQGQGKGQGGGGGGGSASNWILEVEINDLFTSADGIATRLLSDGKERTGADDDSDGFLELVGSMDANGLVLYRDHRLEAASPDRDPCVQLELSTDASPGRTRMNFSRRSSEEFSPNIRCDLDNRYKDDDERTFQLVFDKSEGSVVGNVGGACACDKFAYVNGITGSRTELLDDTPAAGFCTLAIAPGEIAPGGENTGARITAWPFEDLLDSKKAEKKAGQTADGHTTVNIRFRTDVEELSEQILWTLSSQGETVPISELDTDTRAITAEGQLFDLTGPDQVFDGGGQCSDISMTFELIITRIDLNEGS